VAGYNDGQGHFRKSKTNLGVMPHLALQLYHGFQTTLITMATKQKAYTQKNPNPVLAH
jgi:hypothetical protein